MNIDANYHPQLVHHQGWGSSIQGHPEFHDLEHWALHFIANQGLKNERSYKLAIRYYHGDPDEGLHHFRMYQLHMGHHVELVTGEQFSARVDAIRENEGMDAAEEWISSNASAMDFAEERIMTQSEFDLMEALKRRWLAICELISPHVTL